MQLLVKYDIADYATFKQAFDEDSENRSNASLGLLQMWRENAQTIWVLFDVRDAKRTRSYLDGGIAVFHSQAGISASEYHMLETA